MDPVKQKINIGQAISAVRREKHLTQLRVSQMTGLSKNYISDIENGRCAPSLKALTKLAECLELDHNFLSLRT